MLMADQSDTAEECDANEAEKRVAVCSQNISYVFVKLI